MDTTESPEPIGSAPTLHRRGFLIAVGAGVATAAIGLPGAASAAGTWSNPAMGTITSGYKPPARPTHSGTDVANSQGTSIWAACGGTVIGVRTNSYPGDTRPGLLPGRTGNAVLIDHNDGRKSYYGHLYSASVSVGQNVSAGQQIAKMGTTGNSTGPHLHFEIHVNGATTNPYTFLSNRGIRLGSTPPGGGKWPVVKQGTTHERVRVIQHLLTAHGHSTRADAYFGSGTATTAKAFQRSKGLVADAVIGSVTWPVLVLDVKKGAQGSKAKAAQVGLNRFGAKLLVDGDYATVSVDAAKAFQRSKGLVADGWVGPKTWSLLVA